jgi:hypothetical protein
MTTIGDGRSEMAEDMIVHNLIEALEHLREDLKRVELWIAALGQFQALVSEQPNRRRRNPWS